MDALLSPEPQGEESTYFLNGRVDIRSVALNNRLFETLHERENLVRFPGKEFVRLGFKADFLNLLWQSLRKDTI